MGRSSQAMRDRLRELSKPNEDDYDRAVICVLDDFEDLERYVRSLEKLISELARQIEARTALDKDRNGDLEDAG